MIELKNISKSYQMGNVKVDALCDVSLKVSSGEFIAIMGPSGSGKSTLMHILGLLDRPDEGSYSLCGTDLTKLSDEDMAVIRNSLIGFIFQQFHLLPRLSALENAQLPLIYAGKRHLRHKAQEQINIVGLKERISHKPNELSGGQQQRVAIARALVNSPLIIMADEPTGNLDSKSKEEIIAILHKLNEQGKTVIVVTHEKEIAACTKRVIHVHDGKIVSDEKITNQTFSPAPVQNSDIVSGVLLNSKKKYGGIKFFEYFLEACSSMFAHKMRSVLSILGILIGVAAVIAMLAVGEGARVSIQTQLASLGSNLLSIRSGSSKVHGVALATGSVTRFTFRDVDAIRKFSEHVTRISPSVSDRAQVVRANKNWNTQVEGVGTDYENMRASVPALGRFFNKEEVAGREKVALIGMTVARELFGDVNPVGETIKINLINFRIIGILPSKGANSFHDQDDIIIVPITTAMYRLFGKQYIDNIYVEVSETQYIDQVKETIEELLVKQHHLKEGNDDSFHVRDMSDIKNALESTTKTMSLLLGSIAIISLIVGGIGIMNIMLVSVTERTKEIGLRKAIGANNQDIMIQFLIEAVWMSFIGGVFGVVLGVGVSMLVTVLAGWTVKVSLFSVVLSTIFSLIIGIIFGLWPAKQASNLNPIEALRYE